MLVPIIALFIRLLFIPHSLLVSWLFFLGLIESCLAVWGAYELWTKSCDNLIDSNIWKFAYLTFIIQVIISVLILVILPIISYTDYLDEGNDIESESKIIYNDSQNTKDYLLTYRISYYLLVNR